MIGIGVEYSSPPSVFQRSSGSLESMLVFPENSNFRINSVFIFGNNLSKYFFINLIKLLAKSTAFSTSSGSSFATVVKNTSVEGMENLSNA